MTDAAAVAAVAAAGLAGALAGLVLDRRLATFGHRYDDEAGLPRRSFHWVPVVTAAVAALALWRLADEPVVAVTYAAALVWAVGLVAIDLDVHRLPDRWTLPAIPASAAVAGACAWAVGDAGRFAVALACAAGCGAGYLLLVLVNPAGLGMGDVKLAVSIGMLTGWFGWPQAVLAFFAALVLGLLHGTVAAVVTRGGRSTAFAFGPAMVAGAATVVLLVGPAVLR
jgi:leader peptidase (prepilin peptidase)/N-methyltransferase